MAAGLTLYRALTVLAESLLRPVVGRMAPPGSPLRKAFAPPDPSAEAARGSVWIHAASMGEVVGARRWAETLARHGARVPFLLTTRTATGLARARAELGGAVVAAIAPFDGPRTVRAALSHLLPARIDILETEIWPNWIREARAARVPIVFVSATLSASSERGLRRLGVARAGLLRDGIWVLAQSEEHAGRFQALGVPASRIAVVGDVKAEPPVAGPLPPPFRRRYVVFGSLRPGEEEALVAAARALREFRTSLALIAAPRHAKGSGRARAALRRAGYAVDVRDEASRRREPLAAWLHRLAAAPRAPVGLLTTRGELPAVYSDAAIAIVGGTFAPYGGHSVLEPAARGCPVFVGRYNEEIRPALESLAEEGAVEVVPGPDQLTALLGLWIMKPERLEAAGQGALRAAAAAAGAAERAFSALRAFGLPSGGRK